MQQAIKAELRDEWISLCGELSEHKGCAQRWFNTLCNAYENPQRSYHNLAHIKQVLDIAKAHRSYFSQWHSVFFASWFHDFIQGRGQKNEVLSAQLATRALSELALSPELIENTRQMILSTKDHLVKENSDCALFVDCDLSILGATPELYENYSKQCRLEYTVSNFKYKIGRRRFLTKTLAKKSIYQTSLLGDQLEHKARVNIINELENL
ncbi:HD domain-containing protein [Agarilytica rhodophyticola]|uniref:HD domain-containing protein n=1 Tax=Agarilytica rhodophyticola TaxID=1737490 RepID=UPI000B347D8F|nr:hypothetical protein [Agarilytica rhodophyticola]